MQSKIEIFLFLAGLLFFGLATSDFFSIIVDLFNAFWGTSLPAAFFNSFFFRTILLLFGAFLISSACFFYHQHKKG